MPSRRLSWLPGRASLTATDCVSPSTDSSPRPSTNIASGLRAGRDPAPSRCRQGRGLASFECEWRHRRCYACSLPFVPAKAGTQGHGLWPLDSRFRGNERSGNGAPDFERAVDASSRLFPTLALLGGFRLITNLYLLGACTGRSAGFSPLRMRSMLVG